MFASSHDSQYGTIRVVAESDRIVAVCLEGEFDVANVSALRTRVEDELAGESDLILDLSQATFIDSSVIHVLFSAAKAVNGREKKVILQLGTAPIVERALQLVSIERVLPRAHNREEAVRMASAAVDSKDQLHPDD